MDLSIRHIARAFSTQNILHLVLLHHRQTVIFPNDEKMCVVSTREVLQI